MRVKLGQVSRWWIDSMPSVGENLDGEIGNAFFLDGGQHRVLVQTNHNLSQPTFSDFNSYPTHSLTVNL